MAYGHAAGLTGGLLIRLSGFAARNIRLTVLVAGLLVCGSFAAFGILQIGHDRALARDQAAAFHAREVQTAAQWLGRALDALAATAPALIESRTGPDAAALPPGLSNILRFDADGGMTAALRPANDIPPLSAAMLTRARHEHVAVPPGILLIGHGDAVLALVLDAPRLLPADLRARAAIALRGDPNARAWPVPGWPLEIDTAPDESGLPGWPAMLPVYLLAILGPALIGAGLSVVFVPAFERRARASEAIRALRFARPIEAKLLVRLADAERQAHEAIRSKSEFIAHMSHELRTPLNAVIGFSETIEQGVFGPPGHPKYTEYARDIANAGRDLHTKIGGILEFANVEAGRYPLAPAAIDAADIAAACMAEHQGRAFSRRISLDAGAIRPTLVHADAMALRRILGNLIDNALAYTPEGGAVRVDAIVHGSAALIRVRDNGVGFSAAERADAGKPFRRFDRAHKAQGASWNAATGAGLGLGLAIAMALARRMGGSLNLGGAPGAGTVAELRLPLAAADAATGH